MVSFVIPYRQLPDRAGRLERLLTQLFPALEPGMQIIVSSQSPEPDEEVEGLSTIYVRESREIYNPGRARNLGIGLAYNTWICALDVDVIPPDGFCEQLKACLPAHPMTYCTFEVREGLRLHFDPPTYWGSAAFLFSKPLWYEAGGYCESYELYGYEDPDFCDRCKSVGAKIVHLPITVQHDPHPQVEGIHEALARNREIYERRRN